jgi:hypothetical protein
MLAAALPMEKPMRYAPLLLLVLLPGCTLVPLADAGPCVAVSNARGCQDKPYIVRSEAESTAQSDSSQKAGTAR